MILHALTNYYERKRKDDEHKAVSGDNSIAPVGWIRKKIDYIAVLNESGECVNLQPVFTRQKTRFIGLDVLLPNIGPQARAHANNGQDANLLWDNASFVFGMGKGKSKIKYFIDTIEKFEKCLGDCRDAGVSAVKAFCKSLQDNPELTSQLLAKFDVAEGFEGRNPVIAFCLKDDGPTYIHDRPAVRVAYDKARELLDEAGRCIIMEDAVRVAYDNARLLLCPDTIHGTCLVTGKNDGPIAKKESVIMGVWGAKMSGARIVSFNDPAFESGKRNKKGENAPISQYASFAYTTALDHLLREESPQRMQVGDASVVFWADKDVALETGIVDCFSEPPKDDPDRGILAVATLCQAIKHGLLENDEGSARFFVLGLAPNAARIAIRFWICGTVEEMAVRIKQHLDDLAIEHSQHDKPYLSLFRLLVSVATQGKADNIPPNLGGELMRSVLADLPYPETLLAAAVRRIRAEHTVTYARAALIKACINRATRYSNPNVQEELTMSLDEANVNVGYRLGRLFAVLEKIQEEANPGINATIRDRYYGAASSTPVTVFSTLLKLKNHHLSKLNNLDKRGRVVNLEKRIGEIMGGIGDFPAQLALADQGRFAIGYYHQRQDFFKKANTETSTEGA